MIHRLCFSSFLFLSPLLHKFSTCFIISSRIVSLCVFCAISLELSALSVTYSSPNITIVCLISFSCSYILFFSSFPSIILLSSSPNSNFLVPLFHIVFRNRFAWCLHECHILLHFMALTPYFPYLLKYLEQTDILYSFLFKLPEFCGLIKTNEHPGYWVGEDRPVPKHCVEIPCQFYFSAQAPSSFSSGKRIMR